MHWLTHISTQTIPIRSIQYIHPIWIPHFPCTKISLTSPNIAHSHRKYNILFFFFKLHTEHHLLSFTVHSLALSSNNAPSYSLSHPTYTYITIISLMYTYPPSIYQLNIKSMPPTPILFSYSHRLSIHSHCLCQSIITNTIQPLLHHNYVPSTYPLPFLSLTNVSNC